MIDHIITIGGVLIGALAIGLWCRLCWILVKDCFPKK